MRSGAFVLLTAIASGCTFDDSTRWVASAPAEVSSCQEGQLRCEITLQRCERRGSDNTWVTIEDCRTTNQICAPELLTCATCRPSSLTCHGSDVVRCNEAGTAFERERTCEGDGVACRDGTCQNLCSMAAEQRSNVGCEYWAVDLDNANVDDTKNAAAQQFAVVVSNPQPDVVARVTVTQDDTNPRQPGEPERIAEATLTPLGLRVFKLGPREVDGSAPGTFNTGTHSALTRAAYRIRSDVPIIAYQFNPLENYNVFSNDASLLKPTEALGTASGSLLRSYVVLGWPQTIATTDDPTTNFSALSPIDLRGFVTIVGTRDGTRVRVKPTTRVIGTGPRAATLSQWGEPEVPAILPDETFETTLDAFDVLNLETDDFNADFTGTLVDADSPIAVFSGSEASDAPYFSTLTERYCCADHLEEQIDPLRTAGKTFVATVSANRTTALAVAGATIGIVDQPEYFRVVAVTDDGAQIVTSLTGKDRSFTLDEVGSYRDITATEHFVVTSTQPIALGHVTPSQQVGGVERTIPGGDPSLTIVPPIEQFRSSYVFLTPDKYAFDFVRIVAPPDTTVLVDEQPLESLEGCSEAGAQGPNDSDPSFRVFTCQLSFPVVTNAGDSVSIDPGEQNDGVHRVYASRKVGVMVDGFDRFVSYGYAAGTELRQLTIR